MNVRMYESMDERMNENRTPNNINDGKIYLDEQTKETITDMSNDIHQKSREVGSELIDDINEVSEPITGMVIENTIKEELEAERKAAEQPRLQSPKELAGRLRQAIGSSDSKSISSLIKKGADVNYINHKNEQTLLHYAIQLNRAPIVSLLLTAGADANAIWNKKTPLESTTDLLIQNLIKAKGGALSK